MALTKRELLIVVICCTVNFTFFFSDSMMTPFYPGEAELRDVSTFAVGCVFGVAPAATFVFAYPVGKYMNKIGKKRLLIIGMALGCIFQTSLAFLDYFNDRTVFLTLSIVLRALGGICGAAAEVSMLAILATQFPTRIATLTGITEIFTGVGYMCGPPVSAFLFIAGGFKLPFFVGGAMSGLVTVMSLVFFPSDAEMAKMESDAEPSSATAPANTSLKQIRIYVVVWGIVISAVAFCFLEPVLEPYLSSPPLTLSLTKIGLLLFLCSGVYGLFSPITGYFADRFGTRIIFVISGFTYAAGIMLAMPSPRLGLPTPTMGTVCAGLILMGAGCAGVISPATSEMIRVSGEENIDAISGIMSASYNLGAVVGPIGGTYLQQTAFHGSISDTALLIASICLLHTVVTLGIFLYDLIFAGENFRGEKRSVAISMQYVADESESAPLLADTP